MLQLIVILTVGFILTPLIELSSSARTQTIAKAVVYILTLICLIVTLFFHRVPGGIYG